MKEHAPKPYDWSAPENQPDPVARALRSLESIRALPTELDKVLHDTPEGDWCPTCGRVQVVSEFALGDRVQWINNSERIGTVLTTEPAQRVTVSWSDGSSGQYWNTTLKPAPPEPPTLLEAAEAVVNTLDVGGVCTTSLWPEWTPRIQRLHAAIEREKAKP